MSLSIDPRRIRPTSDRLVAAALIELDNEGGGGSANNGWSPIFAVVADGNRSVLQLVDWVGGEGTKPDVGLYVGPTGFTDNISIGVDLKGETGESGEVINTLPITDITYDINNRVESYNVGTDEYTISYNSSGINTIVGGGKTLTIEYDGNGRVVNSTII